jgi:hypothetical protein
MTESWHAECEVSDKMTRINAICPISTRTAYFGSRRIAPAAPTSRSQGWGARPSVEEERPAQHNSQADGAVPGNRHVPLVAAFVTQVLSQGSRRPGQSASTVSASYEAAERVDAMQLRWLSATI